MITTTALLTSYISPADTGLASIIADGLSLVPAGSSIHVCAYSFVDDLIYQGLIAAQNRGVDTQLLLDHSQATTPGEAAKLVEFFKLFPRQNAVIGTSDSRDQIIHTKVIYVNYNGNTTVPSNSQCSTWQDAIIAGYPVLFEGSYNFSASAAYQVNTMNIIVSAVIVQQIHSSYVRLHDWNIAHNKNLNEVDFTKCLQSPSLSPSP